MHENRDASGAQAQKHEEGSPEKRKGTINVKYNKTIAGLLTFCGDARGVDVNKRFHGCDESSTETIGAVT